MWDQFVGVVGGVGSSLFCVKKAQSACGIRTFGCFLKKLGEVFLMMMMMTGFDADE
jgi:hypothetical protein